MLNLFLAAALAANAAVPAGALDDRAAIRQAVGHSLTSVFVVGDAAIARGSDVHAGLRRTAGGWRVVCRLGAEPAPAHTLQHRCGFGLAAASELAADESANAAAAIGQFTIASSSERTAYRYAQSSLRQSEAARLQLLNRLAGELQQGLITRRQAIAQWNQLRFTFFLP